ncbi:30S ribosomal protein S16 [Streptomyces sp. KL116D]|uniref:30S ribosomal protein S16 n=1 Tax=Streptomyces sp. KL116D TaxID=3045152 RepID=UPI00355789D0
MASCTRQSHRTPLSRLARPSGTRVPQTTRQLSPCPPTSRPGDTTRAVKIKLKRLGKIRSPHYRIVVADSRTRRDGRAIEEIGLYHPVQTRRASRSARSARSTGWVSARSRPSRSWPS